MTTFGASLLLIDSRHSAAALRTKLPTGMILNSLHKGKEDDTVAILFTSGSEKDPKVVQLTHKNIASNIINFSEYVGITGDDIILANLVFFHIFGLTVNLWVAFVKGMTMVSYANPTEFTTICKIAREGLVMPRKATYFYPKVTTGLVFNSLSD